MIFVEEQKYKNEIGIYQIKNKSNNKVYIGQTIQSFQRRYWLHQWKLRNNVHDNKYLQNAWNKYGEDNFEFSVVEITDKNNIDEREKYWIKYYKDRKICYSIQSGGQEKRLVEYVSEEGRKTAGEKNRQHLLGSHASEKTKKKMSESRKGKYVPQKTNVINPEIARKIKEMLIAGIPPKRIMEELNIPYRPINGIISMNTWSHVKVDGWDEFQEKRPKGKGKPSVGIKSNQKQTSCEPCAKPRKEEGATTIRKE